MPKRSLAQTALADAIALAGSQSELARRVGVTQATVWKWLQRSKGAAAEFVIAIEESTGVSRHDLRGDIYPLSKPEIGFPTPWGITNCDRRGESQNLAARAGALAG